MRIVALLPILMLTVPCTAIAAEPASQQASLAFKSATKARDIDGISLGMSIEEVGKRMTLTPIGPNEYAGAIGNVRYHLETTPLGRVFKIASAQLLGSVPVDEAFNRKLNAKLAAKYGLPDQGIDGRYWDLIETVAGPDGRFRRFCSNSFAVKIVQNETGVQLTMAMMDTRYLLSDKAKTTGNTVGAALAYSSF